MINDASSVSRKQIICLPEETSQDIQISPTLSRRFLCKFSFRESCPLAKQWVLSPKSFETIVYIRLFSCDLRRQGKMVQWHRSSFASIKWSLIMKNTWKIGVSRVGSSHGRNQFFIFFYCHIGGAVIAFLFSLQLMIIPIIPTIIMITSS